MKKALIFILLIAILGIGAYMYVTRPVAAPTVDVQDVTDTLNPLSDITAVYRIADGSKAEFQIDEMLYGKPKLVVGTSTAIAGDIAITNDHIQMGEMKLDARTLVTDSAQRNGAINRLILKTGTPGNEYVVFIPNGNDFSGAIEEGKEISFSTTGDLTISGVTKPATFQVTMTVGADKITGRAETTIKRSDYGLTIPNLSFIANVDEEFPVFIDVVAERVVQ